MSRKIYLLCFVIFIVGAFVGYLGHSFMIRDSNDTNDEPWYKRIPEARSREGGGGRFPEGSQMFGLPLPDHQVLSILEYPDGKLGAIGIFLDKRKIEIEFDREGRLAFEKHRYHRGFVGGQNLYWGKSHRLRKVHCWVGTSETAYELAPTELMEWLKKEPDRQRGSENDKEPAGVGNQKEDKGKEPDSGREKEDEGKEPTRSDD
ncbi:MAG: hypothetical protein ACLFWL_17960 [Candidatus Brocadiia bacterium]